jgi:hypothetical protein
MKKKLVTDLSKEILYTMSENLIIMTTSLVSSIILENRSAGFREEELHKKVVWLYNEI